MFFASRSLSGNGALHQEAGKKPPSSRSNALSFETDELSNALAEPSDRPSWLGSKMKYTSTLEIDLPENIENRKVFRFVLVKF